MIYPLGQICFPFIVWQLAGYNLVLSSNWVDIVKNSKKQKYKYHNQLGLQSGVELTFFRKIFWPDKSCRYYPESILNRWVTVASTRETSHYSLHEIGTHQRLTFLGFWPCWLMHYVVVHASIMSETRSTCRQATFGLAKLFTDNIVLFISMYLDYLWRVTR